MNFQRAGVLGYFGRSLIERALIIVPYIKASRSVSPFESHLTTTACKTSTRIEWRAETRDIAEEFRCWSEEDKRPAPLPPSQASLSQVWALSSPVTHVPVSRTSLWKETQ